MMIHAIKQCVNAGGDIQIKLKHCLAQLIKPGKEPEGFSIGESDK
jgi:hypothetical protein